jgi:hypothetical protein
MPEIWTKHLSGLYWDFHVEMVVAALALVAIREEILIEKRSENHELWPIPIYRENSKTIWQYSNQLGESLY